MTEAIAEHATNKVQSVESSILRIKCADGSRITGSVNLNRFSSGKSDRVSDFDKPMKHKTLIVNREYIVWATPDEDQ